MNEFDNESLAHSSNPITNWFANKRMENKYTADQQVIAGQNSRIVEDYSMEVIEEARNTTTTHTHTHPHKLKTT